MTQAASQAATETSIEPMTVSMSGAERFGLLALLLVIGAGWGLTQPLSKIAVSEGYRHFGLIFWQFAVGSVILAVITIARRQKFPKGWAQWGFCALIAVLGTVLPNAAGFQAAVYLPAGIISVLLSLVPILAYPVALSFGTDQFHRMRLFGLLLGLVAVAFIALPQASLPDPGMLRYLPLALVAPLFYAFEGNIVARYGTQGLDPIQVLLGASLIGMVICAPLALFSGSWIDPRPPWGLPDMALIVSSIIHALIYSAYVWLVGRAGAV
ncbi:MAG: DMT family transporter, partial [Mangrovicoccus sp.]